MNLAPLVRRAVARVADVALLSLLLFCPVACGPRLPSPEELAEFNAAGPARPVVDLDRVLKSRKPPGPYRVVPGDVLQLEVRAAPREPSDSDKPLPSSPPTGAYRVVAGDVLQLSMPGILLSAGEDVSDDVRAYECRVSEEGKLRLPTAGDIEVVGKTLFEIEQAVIGAYFPKYVRERPSIVARVAEHRTTPVSVVGAVKIPGKCELRSDETSLIPLLAKAGGIVQDGATLIEIRRAGEAKPILVPVLGSNIPAADVGLRSGDLVKVEPCVSAAGGYTCRVDDSGTIRLPVAGPVKVSGKTLAEVESAVADTYFPRYAATRPPVVAKLAEYRTASVSVVGAVKEPGRYELRADEMSLFGLLMKANGIVADGAAAIRIYRNGHAKGAAPVVLPIEDLNVPTADVPVQEGDTVEVERLKPQFFTVVGLVNRPGTFPYPPGVRYTLQHALGFSSGIDPVGVPPYATIYRQNGDGRMLTARFRLGGQGLSEAAEVIVKPGDVIALDQTTGTRTRLFFRNLFRVGVYASYPIAGP